MKYHPGLTFDANAAVGDDEDTTDYWVETPNAVVRVSTWAGETQVCVWDDPMENPVGQTTVRPTRPADQDIQKNKPRFEER